ncbi:MAG: PD40 domain-containing protein [candidate division WOR-3 bacterium]|nr:MAG: PD40 domain-containing protein [candidate division WOR-3 bacterium]
MYLKKIKKHILRVLFGCLLALLYIGGFCESPYTTNANLKFIAGDTLQESTHNFNPVVSPDGDRIYYLSVPKDEWSGGYENQAGSIYSVNIDGSDATQILNGKFDNLAISPDGDRLAVQCFTPLDHYADPESLIIVVEISNSSTESLWISLKEQLKKIVWSNSGDYLYFLTDNDIRRINVDNSIEEIVNTVGWIWGFDLFNNDSIHVNTALWKPEIEPNDQRYVLGSTDYFSRDLLIEDFEGDTMFALPESLTPYIYNWVAHPYWFPDGRAIVFAAAPIGGGAPGNDAAEIWLLENLFEQIE